MNDAHGSLSEMFRGDGWGRDRDTDGDDPLLVKTFLNCTDSTPWKGIQCDTRYAPSGFALAEPSITANLSNCIL